MRQNIHCWLKVQWLIDFNSSRVKLSSCTWEIFFRKFENPVSQFLGFTWCHWNESSVLVFIIFKPVLDQNNAPKITKIIFPQEFQQDRSSISGSRNESRVSVLLIKPYLPGLFCILLYVLCFFYTVECFMLVMHRWRRGTFVSFSAQL